eukprot:1152616_1
MPQLAQQNKCGRGFNEWHNSIFRHIGPRIFNIYPTMVTVEIVAKCIKPTETTTAPKRSTTALKTKSYDVADDAANILFQNHKITTRYVQRNNVRMSLIF